MNCWICISEIRHYSPVKVTLSNLLSVFSQVLSHYLGTTQSRKVFLSFHSWWVRSRTSDGCSLPLGVIFERISKGENLMAVILLCFAQGSRSQLRSGFLQPGPRWGGHPASHLRALPLSLDGATAPGEARRAHGAGPCHQQPLERGPGPKFLVQPQHGGQHEGPRVWQMRCGRCKGRACTHRGQRPQFLLTWSEGGIGPLAGRMGKGCRDGAGANKCHVGLFVRVAKKYSKHKAFQ